MAAEVMRRSEGFSQRSDGYSQQGTEYLSQGYIRSTGMQEGFPLSSKFAARENLQQISSSTAQSPADSYDSGLSCPLDSYDSFPLDDTEPRIRGVASPIPMMNPQVQENVRIMDGCVPEGLTDAETIPLWSALDLSSFILSTMDLPTSRRSLHGTCIFLNDKMVQMAGTTYCIQGPTSKSMKIYVVVMLNQILKQAIESTSCEKMTKAMVDELLFGGEFMILMQNKWTWKGLVGSPSGEDIPWSRVNDWLSKEYWHRRFQGFYGVHMNISACQLSEGVLKLQVRAVNYDSEARKAKMPSHADVSIVNKRGELVALKSEATSSFSCVSYICLLPQQTKHAVMEIPVSSLPPGEYKVTCTFEDKKWDAVSLQVPEL